MNAQSIQAICKLRGMSQSDLARMAGVSRQAVSHWFRNLAATDLNVRSPHLKQLAEKLGIRADDLLHPLPLLDDLEVRDRYETLFLWDRLYPTLADFAVALIRGEGTALARLVQVFGLYQASKTAGRKVWDRFSDYKRHIRPVRREQLEKVWNFRQSLIFD